jgi:hypothetical protein
MMSTTAKTLAMYRFGHLQIIHNDIILTLQNVKMKFNMRQPKQFHEVHTSEFKLPVIIGKKNIGCMFHGTDDISNTVKFQYNINKYQLWSFGLNFLFLTKNHVL